MNFLNCFILLLLLTAKGVLGQPATSTNRIAIYPFRDNAASSPQQIGERLYDRLVSGFSNSGIYQVIDRQFLEDVIKEQRLPRGLFDDATAVRVGKLLNAPVILFGTVTTFTVNPNASDDATDIYGTVTVATTARIVSTETGAILKAPVANETARGVVRHKPVPTPQRPCTTILGQRICGPAPAPPARPPVELKTLDQLLDQAIEACGRSLVTQILAPPVTTRTSAAPSLSASAKVSVIGVSQGMTYINKGSDAGLKVGQEIRIYRIVQTGLVNPDDGTPITRKNQICVLTLSDVEERNSSGTCVGNSALSGDTAELLIQ